MTKTNVKIQFHKRLKKSPYRVRAGKFNVYMPTLAEAKRVKRFTLKLLEEVNNVND